MSAAGVITAGALGLAVLAPAAHANPVEHEVGCTPPPAGGPAFTWTPRVELSVSPPGQGTYKVGEEVTVTWHWVTPPRNPWTYTGILADQETPTGTVRLSTAQIGDVAVSGPARHPGAGAAKPLAVSDMTGRFTIAAEGRIDLAPGGYRLDQPVIAPSPCRPTNPQHLPVSASITVGLAQVPGEPSPGGSPDTGGATGDPGTGDGTGTAGPTAPPGASTPPPSTLPPTAVPGTVAPSASVTSPAPSTPAGSMPPLPQPIGQLPPLTPVSAPNAGQLSMRQERAGVTMPGFESGSAAQNLDGRLNPVSVQDHRGSTLGWTLTAQVTDFVGTSGDVVPGRRLTWSPSCTALEGAPGGVDSGPPGPFDSGPEVLCRQDASGGAVTGGVFEASAALRLALPDGRRSQGYTGNITLSLS